MEKLEARLEKALDELNLSDDDLKCMKRAFRRTVICAFCWFPVQQCKLCKAAFPTLESRREEKAKTGYRIEMGSSGHCPCHNYSMRYIKKVTQRILKWIDEREGNNG